MFRQHVFVILLWGILMSPLMLSDQWPRWATSDYVHRDACPIFGGTRVIFQSLRREVEPSYMGVF